MIKIIHHLEDKTFAVVFIASACIFTAGICANKSDPDFIFACLILLAVSTFLVAYALHKLLNPKIDIDAFTEAEINERVEAKLKQIKDAL